LIGSLALMQQFAVFIETSISGFKPVVRPYRNIFEVKLNGVNAARMLDIIYTDCAIALPRKLERAKKITEREEIDLAELSKRVRKKRLKENLSFAKLSSKIKISVGMLWKVEKGRDIPYGLTRARLASWVDIPFRRLF